MDEVYEMYRWKHWMNERKFSSLEDLLRESPISYETILSYGKEIFFLEQYDLDRSFQECPVYWENLQQISFEEVEPGLEEAKRRWKVFQDYGHILTMDDMIEMVKSEHERKQLISLLKKEPSLLYMQKDGETFLEHIIVEYITSIKGGHLDLAHLHLKQMIKTFVELFEDYTMEVPRHFLPDLWTAKKRYQRRGNTIRINGKNEPMFELYRQVRKSCDYLTSLPQMIEHYQLYERWKQEELENHLSSIAAPVLPSQEEPIILTVDAHRESLLDDAFALETNDKKETILRVYIADITPYLKKSYRLLKHSLEWNRTIYLQSGQNKLVFPLLPVDFCEEHISLREGKERNVLCATFTFDQDANLKDVTYDRRQITVTKNLTVDDTEDVLEHGGEYRDLLTKAVALSEKLESKHKERNIYQERYSISRSEKLPSQKFIREFAVYVNSKAAELMKACLYQNNTDVYSSKTVRPNVRREMDRFYASTQSLENKGLQLQKYATVTNPMRNAISMISSYLLKEQAIDHCDKETLRFYQEVLPYFASHLNMSRKKENDIKTHYRKIMYRSSQNKRNA